MNHYGEILTIDGLLTKEECQAACQKIDDLIQTGYCHEAPTDLSRRDECVHLSVVSLEGHEASHPFLSRFHSAVLPEYASRFPILKFKNLGTLELKAQKTPAGGGFHDWHHEACDGVTANRWLAYTLYLNDDFEGGETEFLHQNTRIKPVAGRCSVFPTGFLHTHRGNPPINGTKYILTGWVIDLDPFARVRA